MRESYTNSSESKWIESFKNFGLTNRIHDTNLLEKVLQIESAKQIFWKKALRIESAKQIFNVRICESGLHVCQPGFVRIRFVL